MIDIGTDNGSSLMKTANTVNILFLIAILASCGSASAAGWTAPLTVTSAFTEDSDLVVAYTDGPIYTNGCSQGAWIFQASTDPRRARAYATLLAAIAAGKKISFWFADTCATWNYHLATSVRIIQ